MKKIFYLLAIISLPVWISCSGDNDDDEPVNFSWDGNWNDPEHPKYNGYYNPIEGLWKSITNPAAGLYFSEVFDVYTVDFKENGTYVLDIWRSGYEINDQAYKYFNEIRRYKIERDKLYLYPNRNDNKDARVYQRVEE